jgi:L-iditol 2-dehydrogenase
VKDWVPGDRVTFDSTIYCGDCDFCRSGQVNLCERRRVLGVSCEDYRQDGAFAELVKIPQRILYRLPETLPFEHAALVEPYSIALHAVHRVKDSFNTAIVLGAGMIGLAIVQMLKHAGCPEVIAVDVAQDRLSLAKQCGASTINSATENVLETILSRTDGRGVDAAFEAVGINATVDLALRTVRRGATVVLVGNVTPTIQFPLQIAVTRELSVLGSCASRGEYSACIDLLARGALNPAPLIGAVARYPREHNGLQGWARKNPGCLK